MAISRVAAVGGGTTRGHDPEGAVSVPVILPCSVALIAPAVTMLSFTSGALR
jgi:hypothetical protein